MLSHIIIIHPFNVNAHNELDKFLETNNHISVTGKTLTVSVPLIEDVFVSVFTYTTPYISDIHFAVQSFNKRVTDTMDDYTSTIGMDPVQYNQYHILNSILKPMDHKIKDLFVSDIDCVEYLKDLIYWATQCCNIGCLDADEPRWTIVDDTQPGDFVVDVPNGAFTGLRLNPHGNSALLGVDADLLKPATVATIEQLTGHKPHQNVDIVLDNNLQHNAIAFMAIMGKWF